MKILVDMNLPPAWCDVFRASGWDSVHWSDVGDPRAPDPDIMAWASSHGFVVFTHDLDFGAALALTHAMGPSVIQVRTQDVLPSSLAAMLVQVLMRHQSQLEAGALIVVDEAKQRIRILPI
ncbi:MAG TPA: DUF5615 family PIN-like protein [Pirellulales bacterium]|nr:DUF5615 family PIN-like protein [Pirellulales bacterium]